MRDIRISKFATRNVCERFRQCLRHAATIIPGWREYLVQHVASLPLGLWLVPGSAVWVHSSQTNRVYLHRPRQTKADLESADFRPIGQPNVRPDFWHLTSLRPLLLCYAYGRNVLCWLASCGPP